MEGNVPNQAFFETLVQNAQKGEYFYVKLRNDPIVYLAIPLIHYSMDTQKDSMFVMQVVEPPEYQGVFEKLLVDVEWLERKHP